ncbi:DUF4091 domain-containing protein [Candidatus Poribacteria bacterium]|nr:DUF4091 domain-containing protein [Candidatus Poribacteria bacterium]
MLILLPFLPAVLFNSTLDDAAFQLWAEDPLVKIFKDTPFREIKCIEISCAGNEYQAGQFAITTQKKLENVTVQLSSLTHESGYILPQKHVSWNFVGYVPLTKNTYHTPDSELLRKAPADFPDPLIDERSITIDAEKTQPVWLTIFVPKDAPAGKYRGKATVSTSCGKKTLDISLNVHPFALPDEWHLLVTLWFDPNIIAKFHHVEMWSEEYWEILAQYAKNMAEHRQNVVETPFPSPIERKKDGTLEIDYASLDKWVEFFEQANACDRIEFPAVAHTVQESGHNWWTSRELVLNNISVKEQETGETVSLPPEEGLAAMLTNLDKHLMERGWHKKAMVHISDEPTIYKLESYCKAADFVHQHAPHLKIIEAIETTGFGNYLDVWVPKLSHLMNWYDEYEAQRKTGTELWFYTCCHPYGAFPNRFIDFALIKTRILFWLNWKYQLEGYLHWGLNRWTENPFKDVGEDLPPGDRFIIYPGNDGPMNSMRWEASREGLQDYEYFRLLAEKTTKVKKDLGWGADFINEKQRSDEICRSIVRSFTEYETTPQRLREAREVLAQEIIAIGKHPLLLVKTTPPAETEVVNGPILILVRGVVEKGATVKIQGEEAKVEPDGTFAGHAFISFDRPDVIIEAALNGQRKQIRRHFVVR